LLFYILAFLHNFLAPTDSTEEVEELVITQLYKAHE